MVRRSSNFSTVEILFVSNTGLNQITGVRFKPSCVVEFVRLGGLLLSTSHKTDVQSNVDATLNGLFKPSSTRESTVMQDTEQNLKDILAAPSYRLAELDTSFLQRRELRPIRLQLELLKPEMILSEQRINSTIVVFGGTQVVAPEEAQEGVAQAERDLEQSPGNAKFQRRLSRARSIVEKSKYYEAAREFSRLVSVACQNNDSYDYVITTGGGPGIMEAANRGAFEAGCKSMGLNITIPEEQAPNPYITPELCFQFHYFALRKMHFLFRAKALVVFPGGFGTLDELFNALTLRQTRRMQEIPIILFGEEYWSRVVDFQFLADQGVVCDEHLNLISYVETPEQAWKAVSQFHDH